jgi:RNA polymerase sigma-70 factor (ECF subfamily)
VLQNFCVRVIKSGAELRNSESVVAWLYTVLRSVLTDHYRSAAVRRRREDSYASDQMVMGKTHVEINLEESACDCLHKVMPELRSDYAEILRRLDLSDEPRQRVADDLGITPVNARVRLHRARQALRKSLNAFCNSCTDHKLHDCACQSVRSHQIP